MIPDRAPAPPAPAARINGLSLVEVLIVTAIIGVLIAISIPVVGLVMEAARRLATAQRMQAVLDGLTTAARHDGASTLMARLSGPAIAPSGVISATAVESERYEFRPLRHIAETVGRAGTMAGLNGSWALPNLRFSSTRPGAFTFVADEWRWVIDAGSPSGLANFIGFDPLDPSVSLLGENWRETSEIAPPAGVRPASAWFRARWPTVWPASDWDQSTPGSVPPRWGSAWGRPPIDPATGNPGTQAEVRLLGTLSPLASAGLLQLAGVLADDGDGLTAYRNDRSPGRPWNDRWGRPLVVASGLFLPNRSESLSGRDLSTKHPYAGLAAPIVTQARTLAFGRPRDAQLSATQRAYGFSRAVYVAVGAVGPTLSPDAAAALNGAWDEAGERRGLRALWRQVREVCAADEWDQDGFVRPPWTGVRTRRQDGMRCQLTALLEVK